MHDWVSKAWVMVALALTIVPNTPPARADTPPGRTTTEASIATGRQLWVSHYDGTGRRWDFARAVAVSPDGTKVFSTGKSWGGGEPVDCGCGPSYYDYATVAYRSRSGEELWKRRYNGPGNELDDPADIVIGPGSRRVFVTGRSAGATGPDFATVAYNTSTGRLVWSRRYNGPGDLPDEARSVDVSADGSTVFVAGPSGWAGESGRAYAVVAYEASTGSTIWVSRYDAPDTYIQDLVVGPDETTVFATGYADSSPTGGAITIAYDAVTGTLLWQTHHGSVGDPWGGSSIELRPDGERVFVMGSSPGAAGDAAYATIAYDAATGAVLWVSTYQGPAGGPDRAESLDISSDGTAVFVTGSSPGTTGKLDYATVGYDAATGAELWATRYNGPGDGTDVARAGASSSDGSMVVVTGYSQGLPTSPDFATVAYDADTGAELWVELYDGPAHGRDRACAIAIGPNGDRVFVLGYRQGLKGVVDFATVAYSAS